MKNKLLILIFVVLLVGCGKVDREISAWTGKGSVVCVDGVKYLQFTSGVTVAYNKDGTIATCN